MKLKKLMMCIGIGIVALFIITSYFPKLVIRRHLFIDNPIQSITCTIDKTNFIDSNYGQQYIIEGYVGEFGLDIRFAYVKRNWLNICYWSGGGTGP